MIGQCPNCQAEIRVDGSANFCQVCGTKIEPVVQQPPSSLPRIIECPNCKAEITEDAKFCNSCGRNLDSSQDGLSTKGKIFTWVAIMFIPGAILASCILYYVLRKKHPRLASELNKHTWLAFLVAVIIRIIMYTIERMFVVE